MGRNLDTGWDVDSGSGTVILSSKLNHFLLALLPGLEDQGFSWICYLWKPASKLVPTGPFLNWTRDAWATNRI